jgi:hypothetical protein
MTVAKHMKQLLPSIMTVEKLLKRPSQSFISVESHLKQLFPSIATVENRLKQPYPHNLR